MDTRFKNKDLEKQFLEAQKLQYPELFDDFETVETDELLDTVGIRIKDRLPNIFYIKTLPFDFIVEEKTDSIQTDISFKPLALEGQTEDRRTLFATLVKCNIQTTDAVADISNQLGITVDSIGYAGLKDKYAITSQLISLRAVSFENLQKVKSQYFFLKDAHYGNGVIRNGELVANRFNIRLRSKNHLLREEEDILQSRTLKIEKNGFFNFYYLQRFSTPRYTNFHWGYLILCGRYEEAIKLMITEKSDTEPKYFDYIRTRLSEVYGNWEEMLDILEPFHSIFQSEKKVISFLKNNPENYIGALKNISEQTKLWIYAVPSWLFNLKLSEYLENGGITPKKLPLILSTSISDWLPYQLSLKENGIFPLPYKNLKPFSFIQLKTREVDVRSYAKIINSHITKKEIRIRFLLEKGQYATTFLSQICVLAKPTTAYMESCEYDLQSFSKEELESLNFFSEVLGQE